jgi:uncharacterized protein YcbX
VTSDSGDADRVLSAHFGRDVTLARSAPPDFTIEMYRPDIPEAVSADARGQVKDQKLGSALFEENGLPSPVPVGAFFDCFPVSLLTTSTLAKLNALRPQSRFDVRRFRMNVIVETGEPGFPENDWVGREIGIGPSACVRVAVPDSRCVMTTLPQDDLPGDSEILRTLALFNMVKVAGNGPSPCAGVYAVASAPGALRTGDAVTLA